MENNILQPGITDGEPQDLRALDTGPIVLSAD